MFKTFPFFGIERSPLPLFIDIVALY